MKKSIFRKKVVADLTDQDATEVAKLYGLDAPTVPRENLAEMARGVLGSINLPDLPLPIVDFLRSKGYDLLISRTCI